MPVKRPTRIKRSKGVPAVGASEQELFKFSEKQLKAPLIQALTALTRTRSKHAAAFISRWLDPLPGEEAGRAAEVEESASESLDDEFRALKENLDITVRPLLVQAIQEGLRGEHAEKLAPTVGRYIHQELANRQLEELTTWKGDLGAPSAAGPADPPSSSGSPRAGGLAPAGKLPRSSSNPSDPLSALPSTMDLVATDMASALDALKGAFTAASERVLVGGPTAAEEEVDAVVGVMEVAHMELQNALARSQVAVREGAVRVRRQHGAIPAEQQTELLGAVAGSGLEAERSVEEIAYQAHAFTGACLAGTPHPRLQECLEALRGKVLAAVKGIEREVREDMEDLRKHIAGLHDKDKAALDALLRPDRGAGRFEEALGALRAGHEARVAALEEAGDLNSPEPRKKRRQRQPPIFGCLVHSAAFYAAVHADLTLAGCPVPLLDKFQAAREEAMVTLEEVVKELGKAAKRAAADEEPKRFDLKAEDKLAGVARAVVGALEALHVAALRGVQAEEARVRALLARGEELPAPDVPALLQEHRAPLEAACYDVADFVKSGLAQGGVRQQSILANLVVLRDILAKMQATIEATVARRIALLGPGSQVSKVVRDFKNIPKQTKFMVDDLFDKLAAIVPRDHELHSDFIGGRAQSPTFRARKNAWK